MALESIRHAIETTGLIEYKGLVAKVVGLTIESIGPSVELGQLCEIHPITRGEPVKAEVVGFRDDRVILMPLGEMDGIGPGSAVISYGERLTVNVGFSLLGRILDGMGRPIDGGPEPATTDAYSAYRSPPNPLTRKTIRSVLSMGVRAIDGLLTCGKGQRVGIFAGSGVGKSTLMGMIAKQATADVNVIALIGERGREVREFIENELGEEGLRRSVVIVATSDQPALVRVKGALIATAIAEYFRDQGKNVIFMMDSVTRFSMAQREIGLAVGEPPVTRGYTPSVFATLPKLLERAGTSDIGSITGLYTVLVDGDDFNEPISDAVRGILDGHIMLSRQLASRGHYPAIDVLESVSRVMPKLVTDRHLKASNRMQELLSVYREAEDLINIGAYAPGSNPRIDAAIDRIEEIRFFLQQGMEEGSDYEGTVEALLSVLGE